MHSCATWWFVDLSYVSVGSAYLPMHETELSSVGGAATVTALTGMNTSTFFDKLLRST